MAYQSTGPYSGKADHNSASKLSSGCISLADGKQHRKLCQCHETVRAKVLNTFVTRGSCKVIDRSMVEIQKKMLAHHKPDRVIGLKRAVELEHLLTANPSVPGTVMEDESGSIQQCAVRPIFWFLANRGNEWRVYACVPDRGQTAGPDIPGLQAQTSIAILSGISSPSPIEPAEISLVPPWGTSEHNSGWQSVQSVSTVPDVVVKSEIKDDWRRLGKPQHPSLTKRRSLALCLPALGGDQRHVDWVLTKELACITASPVAIAAFANIIDYPTATRNLLLSASMTSTERAPRLIHWLRHLPLLERVQAASRSQFLYLKAFYGRITADDWIENREKAAFTSRLWECRDSQPRTFLRCLKNTYSIAGAKPHFGDPEHDNKILRVLRVPRIAKQ
ncbi:predicted protein [Aspergillus nidulans FGSC A4]|uniref:Uncharacterized protein n=1 Tax=Emericella nidulans (strain FGSC A4 / ATCC 38163 / CBS 112.46 / NRRL 194 / M139) TaxID=227321 RepID=Q5ATR7_EMENI|nr:hypothetical protein [Aspergillus nidulans FGSC A4]EAA66936.1 predicted protein [Aspergillus nidulans FGSC A4]CBF80287.1 TPA: hypothetical protein ANIA_08313 [Aspergillus nidulans FGSC A4]|eukprot:XP_681582.1 predicted protein [Aspergillus nidulans FGSC A4]